jgi:PAP2 superfamily protein
MRGGNACQILSSIRAFVIGGDSVRRVLVGLVVMTSACSSSAREARTDVVIQWNQQVMATGGPHVQRTLAMVHVTMFDAINAVDRRYTPYLGLPAPPEKFNADAAAASAAYGVLVRLFPGERVTLTAALTRSLADIPDGSAKRLGREYGDLAASAICEARQSDNILLDEDPITFGSAPGDYQVTDPEQPKLINIGAARWQPFALTSPAQFRPDPPPALTSARYAQDLEEVKRIGGITGAARSADQEQIARWHAELGVAQMNRIARTEAASDGRSLAEHARLFALLNLALADATTSVFEAKYTYGFWRPVTAIRRAGTDANPETREDLAWSPFLPTPPHPEYPSAHAAIQSAGARVLTTYFGRFHPFRATSTSLPGVTRAYRDFEAFVEEGKVARIVGGMHFRSSVEQGARQGTDVANWVLDHSLLPIRRP